MESSWTLQVNIWVIILKCFIFQQGHDTLTNIIRAIAVGSIVHSWLDRRHDCSAAVTLHVRYERPSDKGNVCVQNCEKERENNKRMIWV